MKSNLIAFAGYGGSGKDEAAKTLIAHGYARRCFGDIIKSQIDLLVLKHLGFSAFTEDRDRKKKIRPILEQWGEVNYEGVMSEFFETLPDRCVNTRLVRVREAQEWARRGGVIVEVHRDGVGPATEWEQDRLEELRQAGLISFVLHNDLDVKELAWSVSCLFELSEDSPEPPPSGVISFPLHPLAGALAEAA